MQKLLLIVLLLIGTNAISQTTKIIRGKVITTNKLDKKSALPGAKIRWVNDANVAVSDVNGKFTIKNENLPDTIKISFTGYKTLTYWVTDASQELDFDLKQGNILDGVEVIAKNRGKSIDLISATGVEHIGEDELRKAACCNLSESFETNASVDVNITDAVSGAKKIQMLGLDGVYTQLQWENIPLVRGLSTSYGLSFTPGTWIESIQITKGTGSVVNGYESMAGMINLEIKKPTESERFYVNLYGNKFGRAEVNFHGAQMLNKKWSTMSFIHYSNQLFESDVNNDGFRDMPIGSIIALMNRWSYQGDKMEAKFGVKATYGDKMGGQLKSQPNDVASGLWNAKMNTEHVELFSKTGFYLKNRPSGSIGLISQWKYHHMNNVFGNSSYDGTQKKGYLNVMYGDIIRNTNHNIKTGLSMTVDNYNQVYNDSNFVKTEIVPGGFAEYTYNSLDKLILVLGVRADYHNLYGPLFAPRFHGKYNFSKRNALRISVGRGYRVPNPYADFMSQMASNRKWIVNPNLTPEDGITSGITFTQKFLTNDHVSTFSVDYFYTHFLNQLIVDMDVDPNEIHIYNTNSTSFSHSVQAELTIKPYKVLELRGAFKYYNVQATYNDELQQKAFVPKYRVLLNIGYESRNKKWLVDVTGNWVGRKRLPSTATNPEIYQRAEISDDYWLLNSQITYNFKKFSVYIGGENLLNVIQKNAIISSNDPFGTYFDATQIWAPISGANVYIGLHYSLKQKK